MPDAEVTVYEAGPKALAKVAVTGGGRCNLTNSFEHVGSLSEVYPRGLRVMQRALKRFSNEDTMEWFEREGVALTVQEDCCVFPVSQDAMQIVRTLERLMRTLGVKLVLNRRVESLDGLDADAVVVTTGGGVPACLEGLGLEIVPPVPSLYTFRVNDPGLKSLMGTVVQDAALSIPGTAFRSRGALLVTDWGLSGPAALRLSSYAARHLAEHGFRAPLLVNWTGGSEEEARSWISAAAAREKGRLVTSVHPDGITARLWEHLLGRAGIRPDLRWAEMGSKGANRLANTLVADSYGIDGRTRFREEFVTCGGVSLAAVDLNTLESRDRPGLYFAGEVLDIDAVTGGFNLQAAWSTGYMVAESIFNKTKI